MSKIEKHVDQLKDKATEVKHRTEEKLSEVAHDLKHGASDLKENVEKKIDSLKKWMCYLLTQGAA